VHEHEAVLDVQQRARAKPRRELAAVGRIEQLAQRVALAVPLKALGDGEEMQVVVAEDRDRRLPERPHEAQALEGIGAAVDEVADEPELVARGIETNRLDEPRERLEAALDVADREGGQVYLAAETM
jgi:hypothetical protein